jgi:hypothetical protein
MVNAAADRKKNAFGLQMNKQMECGYASAEMVGNQRSLI